MKNKLITAINARAGALAVAIVSAVNDIMMPEGQRETWVPVAKYGEYPATLTLPDGRRVKGVQLVDREGAEAMKAGMNSAINTIAHLGRGLPIYEGHPDDKAWLQANPGHKKTAVGRIKEIELRDDGPWMRVAVNDAGYALISGDAPVYSAHSPKFGMTPDPVRPGVYRVIAILSTGLTNDPNIPGNTIGLNDDSATDPPEAEVAQPQNENTMHKEILERLGLKPEASEDAIASAVNTVLDERKTLEGKITALEGTVTAANEKATNAIAQADKFRATAVETTVATAINEGRITEADKPKWVTALNTDFESESKKLGNLVAINTTNHVAGAGARKEETVISGSEGITAINEAVAGYAKEHGLNVTVAAEYDKAYNGAKAAKPELFS